MPHIDVIRPSHDDDPRNQRAMDVDPDVLIYPPMIPRPATIVENLREAIGTMRSAAGSISDGGHDIEDTWGALPNHYSAPGSDTLFSAMGRVSERGDDIQDDIASAVSELEVFADAAETAKEKLGSLREEAWEFREEMQAEDAWSENIENTLRNHQLKLAANKAWADYQDAERDCATALSSISGSGNTYVPAGEGEPDAGEVVYGIDPKDVPDPNFDLGELADWKRIHDFTWDYLKEGDKPAEVGWIADSGMAIWDNFSGGMLWDIGVNAVAATGLWHASTGWADSGSEAFDNAKDHLKETLKDYGALAGVYGGAGSILDDGEFTVEMWRQNMAESWKEVAHDLVPWREWDDRPLYTITTAGGNLVTTLVGGLPVRGGTMLARVGTGDFRLDLEGATPSLHLGPGVAGRPGLNLSDVFGGQNPDGSGGVLGRLNDITVRLNELTTRWSTPAQPVPDRPVSVSTDHGDAQSPSNGPTRSDEPTGLREERPEEEPASTTRRDEAEDRSVRELSQEVDRFSAMDPEKRARFLERRLSLVSHGSAGNDGPGSAGRGDHNGEDDFRVRNSVDGESRDGHGGTQVQDGQSTTRTALLDRDPGGGSGPLNTGDGFGSGGSLGHSGGGDGMGGGGGGRPGDPAPGTGEGGRPPGPKTLAEFERHRWGDQNDPAAQEAFLRDVEHLVNHDEDFRKKYYNSIGRRVKEDLKIGLEKWQLPKLHINENTGWRTPLKQPDSPDYHGDKVKVRINSPDFLKDSDGKPLVGDALARKEKLREDFKSLDSLAERKAETYDDAVSKNDVFKEAEKKYGKYKENGNNHEMLERAHQDKADAYHESTKVAERFGEESAKIAARFEFDGSPLLDKHGNEVMRDVKDDEGNVIGREKVVKPNLDGATLLGRGSGAPGNGNSQFDLIYETKDGDIVIVEAKASTTTSLGTRIHSPRRGRPVDVMQGTRPYLESILDAMRRRVRSNVSVDNESNILNRTIGEDGVSSVRERGLADYIEKKMKEGKVTYALFKGNPTSTKDGYSANGYDYNIFDIG